MVEPIRLTHEEWVEAQKVVVDDQMKALKGALSDLREMLKDPAWTDHAIDHLEHVLTTKGDDYSGDETFWHFQASAQLAGKPIEDPFVHFIAAKVLRLVNVAQKLARGKKLHYEDAKESWRDLAGYSILFFAFKMYKEK